MVDTPWEYIRLSCYMKSFRILDYSGLSYTLWRKFPVKIFRHFLTYHYCCPGFDPGARTPTPSPTQSLLPLTKNDVLEDSSLSLYLINTKLKYLMIHKSSHHPHLGKKEMPKVYAHFHCFLSYLHRAKTGITHTEMLPVESPSQQYSNN